MNTNAELHDTTSMAPLVGLFVVEVAFAISRMIPQPIDHVSKHVLLWTTVSKYLYTSERWKKIGRNERSGATFVFMRIYLIAL